MDASVLLAGDELREMVPFAVTHARFLQDVSWAKLDANVAFLAALRNEVHAPSRNSGLLEVYGLAPIYTHRSRPLAQERTFQPALAVS
jgi:hypothetical protein